MFQTDQPIQSSSQDILGRKYFANSLAETLLSFKSTHEFVLGLFGEWGSGKTSLLNITEERINELTRNDKNKPIIVKFNPWNFSEQNHLITQYFVILSSVLKRKDNNDRLINIGEKFDEYSDIFDPLSVLPVVGQFTFLAKSGFKIFGKTLKNKGKKNKLSLEDLRNELSELLKNIDTKIFVIIDDIDRLTPYEIRQIFQLVKKIADFPNIIYLLAFDKKVVLNALKEVHKGFENEYLEKIIQVPFEIPPLSKEELYNILTQQINRVLIDIPDEKIDQVYWGNIFHSGIKYYFNSLRDVTRFINTLSFNFTFVKGNVNAIDFIAITAIQVFHSDLYYSIRSNKEMFAGNKDSYSNNIFETDNKEKEYYAKLIPENKKIQRSKLEDLLSRLFPRLESVFGNTNYGSDWAGEWRKKIRICSNEYFDVYFRLIIEKKELPPSEMEIILSTANNYEIFRRTLISLIEDNKIIKFLELLEDYTSDENIIPINNIQNIVSVLMDIGDQFPENKVKSLYSFDTPMKVLRVFYQLSKRFPDHNSRFELFQKAIKNSENSIYTIIHEVGTQDQQHGKYSKDKELPIESLTVKPEQLDELHKLALEKIEKWEKKSELVTHDHLGAILYRWKEWAGIERVKIFVNNIISSDKGLVNFVRAFLGSTISYGMSDHTGNVSWKINLNDIKEFIGLNEIEPRLRKIYKSDLDKYSEMERLAVTTFIDIFDGKQNIDY